jgi:thiamine biosynthesis lipoprotein
VTPTTVRLRLPSTRADETFRALGTDVRLLVTGPGAAGRVAGARAEIAEFEACASRFLPGSELSALNADPRPVVPASSLLRGAVRAALWAAERSGGLVDPTLLDALEAAGYVRSYEPGSDAAGSPAGRIAPARPHPDARWRRIRVDHRSGTIERPRGLRLDLGGSGKGFVADHVARRFERAGSWVVDAGGDVRAGGVHDVLVAHPLDRSVVATLRIADGAVATSSIVRRAWRAADGRRAHHLLDPCTGAPVWTGLLAATALAPTTLEAETLSKVALLTGPSGARRALARHGGLVVHADGATERIGPLPEPAVAGRAARSLPGAAEGAAA